MSTPGKQGKAWCFKLNDKMKMRYFALGALGTQLSGVHGMSLQPSARAGSCGCQHESLLHAVQQK